MKVSTRDMAEIAMAAALSAALSFVVIYKLPQGGQVTLAEVPIYFLALRRGLGRGVLAGALAGLAQVFIDPFLVHPLQIALDYPLAWGALGLSGLLWSSVRRSSDGRRNWLTVPAVTLGILVGASGRFLFHFLSGIWFFASFAPAGTPVSTYTALYILSHLGPSTLMNILIVGALFAAGVAQRALPDRQGGLSRG